MAIRQFDEGSSSPALVCVKVQGTLGVITKTSKSAVTVMVKADTHATAAAGPAEISIVHVSIEVLMVISCGVTLTYVAVVRLPPATVCLKACTGCRRLLSRASAAVTQV